MSTSPLAWTSDVPLTPATTLHARASATFGDKLAETRALLQQAAIEFTTADGQALITQASSLGAEDVVITHLINDLRLNLPIFVLDTGALHTDTLALLEQTRHTSLAPVAVFQPVQESVVRFVAREGTDAMYRSLALRKECCAIRKLEPLARALEGKQAWITGLRREQSGNRADVPLRDSSEPDSGQAHGRIKFNPLAHWTWGDVWHYIATHGVAYNPLHDRFFPSIGCAPCTRAISLGEDFRAGRWWWEAELDGGTAKECGLHATRTDGDATTTANTPTTPPQTATGARA
ncbi:MAG: phosphoadenylyl-sulfate reductase [Burkholderiaceae bacterium]|nr:phosphoadenylyl-sulfate reductase [Burkholderiaceae bacterium]